MTSGSRAVVIERSYTAADAHYEQTACFLIGDPAQAGHAGVTEPLLLEPIDFTKERAERATREALPVVETDLKNTLFGI